MTTDTIDYTKLAEFGADGVLRGIDPALPDDPSSTMVYTALAPLNSADNMAVVNFLNDLVAELERAESLHPPFNSHHEAYAVILEELDEYWEEVKKKTRERDPANMYTELVQLATMSLRAVLNLRLHEARP